VGEGPLKIVECIPNFSTGDPKVVEVILDAIKKAKEVVLVDHIFDSYYNRLVATFLGETEAVLDASLEASLAGVRLIDMSKHKGQHPRLGAVDVVPFVPLRHARMEDCVKLARRFGEDFAQRSGVPVYLYAEAARSPERRDINWIRWGEYEALAEMIRKPGREPDYGAPVFNPKSGATIVGARNIMVGFNVNLDTPDLEVAKRIVKILRKSEFSPYLNAMAAFVPERKVTQIGMSLYNYRKAPLSRLSEYLEDLADAQGVHLVDSEVVGAIPVAALLDVARHRLKIRNLDQRKVLEHSVLSAVDPETNEED